MANRVWYEWDIEERDEYGDVLDHDHEDKLADLLSRHLPGELEQLVLVRNESSDPEHLGVEDRQWAYVERGKLPSRFDGGAKIPLKLRRELKSCAFHLR